MASTLLGCFSTLIVQQLFINCFRYTWDNIRYWGFNIEQNSLLSLFSLHTSENKDAKQITAGMISIHKREVQGTMY